MIVTNFMNSYYLDCLVAAKPIANLDNSEVEVATAHSCFGYFASFKAAAICWSTVHAIATADTVSVGIRKY